MKKLLSFLFLSLSAIANAAEDTGKHVRIIGISSSTAHFYVHDNFSESCKYNVIYFSYETEFGKLAYSTLLTAKSTNTALRRIVYSIDPATQICTLSFVEIE